MHYVEFADPGVLIAPDTAAWYRGIRCPGRTPPTSVPASITSRRFTRGVGAALRYWMERHEFMMIMTRVADRALSNTTLTPGEPGLYSCYWLHAWDVYSVMA